MRPVVTYASETWTQERNLWTTRQLEKQNPEKNIRSHKKAAEGGAKEKVQS